MNAKKIYSNLTYRKLKLSDYKKFSELFNSIFKRRISYKFFKWRYFSDKSSFCYGAFLSTKLIANVGLKSLKLNNKNKEIVFSRHSSMVLRKYQGRGIYSILLENIKKKFLNNTRLIVMWPNKNNFANFGIFKKNITYRNLYLYEAVTKNIKKKETTYHKISKIKNFKNYIINNKNFFFKDFTYVKNRYFQYKRNDYLLNKFEHKNHLSLFILKKNKISSILNYTILDHFGSNKVKNRHFAKLTNENEMITFCNKYKLKRKNYKLIDHINLKIGFLKNNNTKKIKYKILKKEFMLSDTDSFISLK